MSNKIYVLDGALLECNQGFTPAKLVVTENQKVKIQGKFKATDMDVQVPQTFGQCKLKPTSGGYLPCVPALQKWTKTTNTATLGGSKKFLYEDSECMCSTGGKVTIIEPMQIDSAGSIMEEFKNIAMTIPGAMLGNDRAPKVVESYWMDEDGKEKIDRINYGEKASIFVMTENMEVGEKVEVRVKAKNGQGIKQGKNELIYAGNVKADGRVALNLVCIDKPKNAHANATQTSTNATNSSASNQNTSEKVILETGAVNKGYTINENGKIIVVNKEGKRAYDWIYGDNPSASLMKKNGMSTFDVGRIKLKNMKSSYSLLTDMSIALVGNADIEDGFGQNGRDLINHFTKGQGKPFVFDTNSNPVKEIKDSSKFKDEFIPKLKKELLKRYEKNDYINKSPESVYHFKTELPTYGIGGFLDYRVNEVTTFIGGSYRAVLLTMKYIKKMDK